MEITITRTELLAGMYLTQGIVEKRTTIPILQNVLIETMSGGVSITATDNDLSVRRHCVAMVLVEGRITTAARKLYEMIRELPDGDIQIRSLENGWIEITSGRARYRLVGMDPREYPAVTAPPAGSPGIVISSATLSLMIEHTVFAVSIDDARQNLSGLFLQRDEENRLRIVATDGHRLAMITRPVHGEGLTEGVIVSRRGVAEIRKALEGADGEVELIAVAGRLHLRRGPVQMAMRLVEGQFPDYRLVLPDKGERLVLVDVQVLHQALKRVAVVSSERTRGVKLQIESQRMELSSLNPDVGEAADEVEIDYDGEPMTIGFNARYLIDALSVLPSGGRVELTLIDEVNPGVLRESGDLDYCYIVMPMRL